jgi:hypothetical protein
MYDLRCTTYDFDNVKNKLLFLFFLLPFGAIAQQEDTLWEDEAETSPYHYENEADLEEIEDGYYYERPPYHPPPLEPLAARKMGQKQWNDASGGLDYSKDVPEPPKERKLRDFDDFDGFNWTSATQAWGSFFQILAIIVAVAAIAFGIWRMLQTPRNKQISNDGIEITFDNLDDYLHETDLEHFLREALAQGNYPLAIRLYYLQAIKTLSEKNAIKWSREKTNRDYLHEMRGHPLAEQFREATRIFERVWYGNEPLSAAEFAALEPKMKGATAGA